jgi:excisionase family DNA binding protein
MTDGQWYPPKQFAAYMGVHLITVRRWIARGEPSIEVIRVGGIVRVRLRATTCYPMPSGSSLSQSAH